MRRDRSRDIVSTHRTSLLQVADRMLLVRDGIVEPIAPPDAAGSPQRPMAVVPGGSPNKETGA